MENKHVKPILWQGKKGTPDWENSCTQYWIENRHGDSYYIVKIGNGWGVQVQESYLTKSGVFKHKSDIPSFNFGYYVALEDVSKWEHIFATKEEALEVYKKQ